MIRRDLKNQNQGEGTHPISEDEVHTYEQGMFQQQRELEDYEKKLQKSFTVKRGQLGQESLASVQMVTSDGETAFSVTSSNRTVRSYVFLFTTPYQSDVWQ